MSMGNQSVMDMSELREVAGSPHPRPGQADSRMTQNARRELIDYQNSLIAVSDYN